MLQGGAGGAVNGDLVLRSSCIKCGAQNADHLFASACRHLTICMKCGKNMAENSFPCSECGVPVKSLVKEFRVRRSPGSGKQYFLGRFAGGLPPFSKDNARWSMRRDVPKQTDPAKEKFKLTPEKLKSKPWILEDDKGAHQFQGQLEGGQQASYYILVKQGKEFHAARAGSWYNFHKLVQYKQLTLEEAEEQMKNRRKTADGFQRWMMKAANTGAAAFGEAEKVGGGGNRRDGDDDANRKKGGKPSGDDEDDIVKPEDFDPEDEVDRGDDWEHEETFSDDDEAVGNDPDEREEGPDVPAPPEIKQEEEDEMETEEQTQEVAGGLSQSGRDMKKLLGKSDGLLEKPNGQDETNEEMYDDDEDGDPDEDNILSPVLAPRRKDDVAEGNQKASASKGTKDANGKGKRKADDAKTTGNASKKPKTEAKKGATPSSKKDVAKKEVPKPAASGNVAPSSTSAGVTEEEVVDVLKKSGPLKSRDLIDMFRKNLKTKEDKNAFADILRRISRIQKRDGENLIVLK